jgi:hypothetical protein
MVNSMVDSVAQGIEETSESLTFPLGCVGVRSCTFLGEPSLFSHRPSYLPVASKFCGCSCHCEKDFSSKVKMRGSA